MLQSTVLAIKELAGISKQMDTEFQSEANGVVADVNSQLGSFGNFEQHQDRIEALQERILRGRDKIKSLSQRVDVVGDRIDGWEKADKEWQERTRKRLKIIWFLVMFVLAAIFLLFFFAQPPDGSEEMAYTQPAISIIPFPGNDEAGASNRTGVNFKPSCSGSDDRLRVFDEL